jgi:hypothetical protein
VLKEIHEEPALIRLHAFFFGRLIYIEAKELWAESDNYQKIPSSRYKLELINTIASMIYAQWWLLFHGWTESESTQWAAVASFLLSLPRMPASQYFVEASRQAQEWIAVANTAQQQATEFSLTSFDSFETLRDVSTLQRTASTRSAIRVSSRAQSVKASSGADASSLTGSASAAGSAEKDLKSLRSNEKAGTSSSLRNRKSTMASRLRYTEVSSALTRGSLFHPNPRSNPPKPKPTGKDYYS